MSGINFVFPVVFFKAFALFELHLCVLLTNTFAA